MQFIILILGLSISANVLLTQDAASEDCGTKASADCVAEVNLEVKAKRNFFKVDCKVLKAAQKCLSDLADRCFSDAKKLELKQNGVYTSSAIHAVCTAQEESNNDDAPSKVDQTTTEAYKPQDLTSKNCGESAATACMEEFHEYMKRVSDASEVNCKILKTTKKCLLDLADRCMTDEERIRYKANIKNMIFKVNSACATRFKQTYEKKIHIDLKTNECLKNTEKLTSFLRECSDKIVVETGIPRPTESMTVGDIKCRLFLMISRCVTKEVGVLCGQRAEQPFRLGMLSTLTDPDTAKSPDCVTAIHESKL